MKYKPLHDFVIVEREPDTRETSGGLVIPDSGVQKSFKGKVLAVGPGKWKDGEFEETIVRAGQTVLFNSRWNNMGENYQHTGIDWPENIHVIQEADVIGVINAR